MCGNTKRSSYWTLDAEHTLGHRVLPDGCMDLLFDLASPSAVSVVGVMTRPIVTPASERASLLGVRFLPGEAFAFVDVAPRETRDRMVSLDVAWGAAARELDSRIREARTTVERLRVLDRELLLRRARPSDLRVRRVVQRVREAAGAVRVAELAAGVGMGERQLERIFDERVGVGPKALARVARVQALLGDLASSNGSASSAAAALGYADQSHLVRDLREIAGLTPTELARTLKMSDSSNPPHGPFATEGEP